MKKLTRREMLKLMSYSAAGLALAGCNLTPSPKDEPKATVVPTKEEATAVPDKPTPTTEVAAGPPVVVTWVEGPVGGFQVSKDLRDAVFAEMSRRMQAEGINVEVRSLMLDAWQDEFPLKFMEPEITCGFNAPGWAHMDSLRDQGGLAAIEDLIAEYGPHIGAAYGESSLKVNTHSDGHLYGLPAVYNLGGTWGLVWREDLRKKYNAPMPTAEEGWPSAIPFLEAIKENEPDLIPMGIFSNSAGWNGKGATLKGARSWGRGDRLGFVIPDVGEGLELMDEEDWEAHLERFQFARSLAEAGLINQAPIPDFEDELFRWLAAGQAASIAWHDTEMRPAQIMPLIAEAFPEAEIAAVDLSGLRTGEYKPSPNLKSGNWAIFNANAPQEALIGAIQWRNWLVADQANADLFLLGIDGVHHGLEANMKFSLVEGVDEANNYRRRWFNAALPGTLERFNVNADPAEEEMWRFVADISNFSQGPMDGYTASPDIQDKYGPQMAALKDSQKTFIQALSFGQQPDVEAYLQQMGDALDAIGREEIKQAFQEDINARVA